MPIRASSVGLGLVLVAAFLVLAQPSFAEVPLCDDSVPTIVGTEGPDVLFGTPGPDVIVGLGGDDQISGPLDGGDAVCGNDGNDTITGSGDMDAFGGEGDDYIEVLGGGDFSYSFLYGGRGNDTIVTGQQDRVVTYLYGGPGDDILRGGPGRDYLAPGTGKDTVDGGTDLECASCTDTLSFPPTAGRCPST